LVRLDNGNVIQVSTVDQAIQIKPKVEKILYLGDILVSYGDFLENNAQLLPASYVEEIWASQLQTKLRESASPSSSSSSSSLSVREKINERLIQLSKEPFLVSPTVKEAFEISRSFNIPLHPKYSFYWDCVTVDEVLLLREKLVSLTHDDYNTSSS